MHKTFSHKLCIETHTEHCEKLFRAISILTIMVAIIRFLLILVIIYYVLKLLRRYVFPFLLKRLIEKQFNMSNFDEFHDKAKKKEGEISIIKQAEKKTKKDDKSGEYIDFEEIEGE